MPVYLNDVYEKAKSQNYMELLAGKTGLYNLIGWVYNLENIQDIQITERNMLVITTGYKLKDEEEFLHFTEHLIENGCCGMIVRTGKYWDNIPEKVKSICEKRNFPLFLMKWNNPVMDLQKEICQQITLEHISEKQLKDALYAILIQPESINKYISIFELGGVSVHEHYCCILMQEEKLKHGEAENGTDWRRKIHHRFRQLGTYFLFEFMGYDIAIVKSKNILHMKEQLLDFNRIPYIKNGNVKLKFGIGCIAEGLINLQKSFKCAKAALRKAMLDHTEIEAFSNIGFYQILLSCEDTEILGSYCLQYLQKIEEYDKRHGTELLKTLRLYLKYESSVNRVAHEMYTHRNTINSRIAKIKELTGEDFETAEEKFSYQLAFYIYNLQNNK